MIFSGLGRKIDRIVAVVVIVGLERSRCRRIGFVLVAASRILEQGRNDRQQHDHNYAEDGDARDQELDDVHVSILTQLAVKNISLGPAFAEETAIPASSLQTADSSEWRDERLGRASAGAD
jgi:deoxycytidylate deaminase